jgi:acyl-CoA thioester hydrolase
MSAQHEYRLLVVEAHLDTFGHVNNATYLQIFEQARWDLITRRGYGLDTIRATRLGPVILEANVRFRKEVHNRQEIVVRTQLLEYEGKIGKLRQRVYKLTEPEELACDATFTIALWDIDARKIVLPTPAWAHAVLLDEEAEKETPG